jgi:hypothetical protein
MVVFDVFTSSAEFFDTTSPLKQSIIKCTGIFSQSHLAHHSRRRKNMHGIMWVTAPDKRSANLIHIIAMADADKNFFNKIITGDETDVLPMTAKQSDRVTHQDHVDNFFFDFQGGVHKGFVPEGKTVNA